jgi:3-hydroxy acid dehydrogenase/malonic semialdehyde reductase
VSKRETTPLEGKRILVTGGTTGIGRATVKMLAAQGARVLTFGRHEPELQASLENARGSTGEVSGLTADVATTDGIDEVFATLDQRLGGIDMLVCCAALGADPLPDMPEDDWRYVVETNLLGYMACAQKALERMQDDAQRHLLFVGSISSVIKARGESVYSATKAGIDAFAETLRKEISDRNIKITVIQPGSTSTDMQECSDGEKREAIAKEEMLYAEEIADGIVYALTRSQRVDVVTLRIEPRVQKTS